MLKHNEYMRDILATLAFKWSLPQEALFAGFQIQKLPIKLP